MSDSAETGGDTAAARALLRSLAAEARQGGTFCEGGPNWQRVRWHAFRYYVLRPALGRGRRAFLALASALIGRRRTARGRSAPRHLRA